MTKEVQKSTKCGTWKVQNFVPFSPTATPWIKINTKFFVESPPTRLQTTHKQPHPRITLKPAVTLRNYSYATTLGFQTSLKMIFVINRSSSCKLASLLFVVNLRMKRSLSTMSYKTRIFKSTASNLKIY